MRIEITPARQLVGEVKIPGDKSISHRGVMFGALSRGETRLSRFLPGDDCLNTIKAFQSMGIDIKVKTDDKNETIVEIQGKGLRGLKKPDSVIQAGNSGTTARLMAGILAGQSFPSVLDGDASLRKRPMDRVVDPLSKMGGVFDPPGNRLPLHIKGAGSLRGIEYTLPVASAQVKSAIIFGALYGDSPTIIHQPALSRDHTEIMFKQFGGQIEQNDLSIKVYPAEELYGQNIRIPGDISSAAFFITASLLVPGSSITMKEIGINPTRSGILEVYRQMGGKISVENLNGAHEQAGEPAGDITASFSDLKGVEVGGSMIPRLIDEIPILALAATQARGTTIIKDAAELKVKESNRIDLIVRTLKALGADIEPTEDGMVINGPTPLTGTNITCEMDHRIAMMGAIAGLTARGRTVIADGQWADVSFPDLSE